MAQFEAFGFQQATGSVYEAKFQAEAVLHFK
jgi:hypothetical protein